MYRCLISGIVCMVEGQEATQRSIGSTLLRPKKKPSETAFYIRQLSVSMLQLNFYGTWRERSSVDGPPRSKLLQMTTRSAFLARTGPQGFYKRHPDLRPRILKPLEWERHNIYEKVVQWFNVIGKELQNPVILSEYRYNVDETGITLSRLTSRKVLLHKDDMRRCRGVGAKRTLVTAIECISADGRCLDPLIIWPRSTLRSDWTTHPTPNWHFACPPSGYSNRQATF